MINPFEFFIKSMEAFNKSMSTLAQPVVTPEFSRMKDGDGNEFIYVDGSWRTVAQFIELYKIAIKK